MFGLFRPIIKSTRVGPTAEETFPWIQSVCDVCDVLILDIVSEIRVILVDLSKFVFPHTDVFLALFFYIRFLFHGQGVEFDHGLVGERMFGLFSVLRKTSGTSVEHTSGKFVGGVTVLGAVIFAPWRFGNTGPGLESRT